MYSYRPCAHPDCDRTAFAQSLHCLGHAEAPEALLAAARAVLAGSDEIRNQNFSGGVFSGLDLAGKSFICCSFIGATLDAVNFSGARLRICFFDSAEIEGCDFTGLDAQFSSFGSASLRGCSFEGSELLHCNFSGARIENCRFSKSSLYDSRFIRSELVTSDFEDCDLKRVYLIPATEVGVSYRYSNTAEAIRDLGHAWQ